MKKIGIIHLSDIHFCSENQKVICHQLNKLLSDIDKISSEENICIDGGMTKLMIYHGEHGWTRNE